jgi:hypothetical protein
MCRNNFATSLTTRDQPVLRADFPPNFTRKFLILTGYFFSPKNEAGNRKFTRNVHFGLAILYLYVTKPAFLSDTDNGIQKMYSKTINLVHRRQGGVNKMQTYKNVNTLFISEK